MVVPRRISLPLQVSSAGTCSTLTLGVVAGQDVQLLPRRSSPFVKLLLGYHPAIARAQTKIPRLCTARNGSAPYFHDTVVFDLETSPVLRFLTHRINYSRNT